MKRLSRRGGGSGPTLMLTSLLDMFTIILIFLIVSFEAEDYEFKLHENVTLPESSARAEIKPAVNVAITADGVFVKQQRVARFEGGELAAADADSGQVPALVKALQQEYTERFGEGAVADPAQGNEPIVVLQADRQLPYRTLYVILRSAASAGFFKYRLAIMKS